MKCIKEEGLLSGSRNFVHLSDTREDARSVGSRHGKPVILQVKALKMHRERFAFYRSESEPGIWLVEEVPPRFIQRR